MSCPMPRCKVGLGSTSSRWARDQAIEKHRKACHPKVTCAELYHKRWKQWKSPKQISLQKSKLQLAITVRTKKLATNDMSPNGHSLLQFLPDWNTWNHPESSKNRDYFTYVKCLRVDCNTWSSACRGSREGMNGAQRTFWLKLSEENRSRLLDLWGLSTQDADSLFASPHNDVDKYGHDLVHFTPKPGSWPVGDKKCKVFKYTTCTKCWRTTPYGQPSVWKVKCDYDSTHAGNGRVRSWSVKTPSQKRVLCKPWGVSIAEANEWLGHLPPRGKS